ncbi:hypothetical protein LINPERPRIM_LOCUS24781, partial [Linum perenne]
IASKVGKVVRFDHTTLEGKRGNLLVYVLKLIFLSLFCINIIFGGEYKGLNMRAFIPFVIRVGVFVIPKRFVLLTRRRLRWLS